MADPIVDELVAIKKLLVYALLENGVSQEAVAAALAANQITVSRMFAKGGVAKRAARQKVPSDGENGGRR
jgi:predicted transcriptional regulator